MEQVMSQNTKKRVEYLGVIWALLGVYQEIEV